MGVMLRIAKFAASFCVFAILHSTVSAQQGPPANVQVTPSFVGPLIAMITVNNAGQQTATLLPDGSNPKANDLLTFQFDWAALPIVLANY